MTIVIYLTVGPIIPVLTGVGQLQSQ